LFKPINYALFARRTPLAKMRLFRYLALTALTVTTTVAAKKAVTSDKYDAYSSVSAPVDLDETAYVELTSAPRDYTLAVLLTALDAKYACGICKEFDSEWSIVGRSWQKADRSGEKRILFATLDFDKGRNVFVKVRRHCINCWWLWG
jgi:oligosaccharyltransferase complex subunit gamma